MISTLASSSPATSLNVIVTFESLSNIWALALPTLNMPLPEPPPPPRDMPRHRNHQIAKKIRIGKISVNASLHILRRVSNVSGTERSRSLSVFSRLCWK